MDQYNTKEDSLYLRAEWNTVEWNSGESQNAFLQRFEFTVKRVKGLTFDEKIFQFLWVTHPNSTLQRSIPLEGTGSLLWRCTGP